MIDRETKIKLLTELEKTGNVTVACLRLGVSRAIFYHWMKFDEKFKKKAISAIRHGRESMVDLVENAMFNKAIKEKDLGAQKYILSHNMPRYKIDRLSEAKIHHSRQPTKVELPKGPDIHDYLHDVEKLANEIARETIKKYQEENHKTKPLDDSTAGPLGP